MAKLRSIERGFTWFTDFPYRGIINSDTNKMTKAEALKRIEENEKNNKELREFIEQADKPKGRWKPREGGEYWFINGFGVADDNYWDSYYISHEVRYLLGNVFKTQEECQAWIDRQKAIVRVNDRIDELNDGWLPDWGRAEQNKWSISYDHHRDDFYSDGWTRHEFPTILKYVADVDRANQIIRECEADLKLIWGIK